MHQKVKINQWNQWYSDNYCRRLFLSFWAGPCLRRVRTSPAWTENEPTQLFPVAECLGESFCISNSPLRGILEFKHKHTKYLRKLLRRANLGGVGSHGSEEPLASGLMMLTIPARHEPPKVGVTLRRKPPHSLRIWPARMVVNSSMGELEAKFPDVDPFLLRKWERIFSMFFGFAHYRS
ncbi:hypothetical protein ANCDUO_09111 [Ancylostoma duodenale]|uniref:Uncharacterized protein n=1 Tax=Ancylostoma duodenale TaxID=51022 RepID=A0A0C2GHG7_9BILA|nr:hypothetical protein ANCDUO_09111 [Ancylostoma duodenale]